MQQFHCERDYNSNITSEQLCGNDIYKSTIYHGKSWAYCRLTTLWILYSQKYNTCHVDYNKINKLIAEVSAICIIHNYV